MGQIEDLRLFVLVVENRGISRAAEKLHIAKSAVSRRLNLLEERYDSRLIDRGPGRWEVTATGLELYQRAVAVVGDADEIEHDFTGATRSLAGPLVVSIPREFGLSFLARSLLNFKLEYPEIQLMVDFDDHQVDLARDNYDFAIRITHNAGTGVVAKQIGTSKIRMVASPAYLERRGAPTDLCALKNHDLLQYGASRRSNWAFQDSDGKTRSVEFQPAMNSNSGLFLLEAVRSGLGIARLPDFICRSDMLSGAVIPVLAGLTIPELEICLVHSQERRLNRRMRLFAEKMEAACLAEKNSFSGLEGFQN